MARKLRSQNIGGRPSIHDSDNITPDDSQEENETASDESHDSSEEVGSSDINNTNTYESENSQSNLYRNDSKHGNTTVQENPKSRWMSWSGLAVFVAFLSVLYTLPSTNENKICSVEDIYKKFPSQSKNTLSTIDIIINDVLAIEPIHPAVFLFLYSKTYPDDFINSIATYASQKLCVDNEYVSVDENVYRKPEVLKDHGYIIHDYKEKLTQSRVMVFKNIHKMSGKVAQALHVFCDEITPLVDRAIYILTLKVDSLKGNEMKLAEEYLTHHWKDLDEDILRPLITRVTSTVMKID